MAIAEQVQLKDTGKAQEWSGTVGEAFEPRSSIIGRSPASVSFVRADLTISGNLESPGEVQVEGRVEGDIHADQVTINDNGFVRGRIACRSVIVYGEVHGAVTGHTVHVSATARICGDIFHNDVAIEAGAFVEGHLHHLDDTKSTWQSPFDVPKFHAPLATKGPGPDKPTQAHAPLPRRTEMIELDPKQHIEAKRLKSWQTLVAELRRNSDSDELEQFLRDRLAAMFSDHEWIRENSVPALLLVTDTMAELRRDGFADHAVELGEAFRTFLRRADAEVAELILLTTIAMHAAKLKRKRQSDSYFAAALEQAIALNQTAIAQQIAGQLR